MSERHPRLMVPLSASDHAPVEAEDVGDAVAPTHHRPLPEGGRVLAHLLPAAADATAIARTALPTTGDDTATTTAIEDHLLAITLRIRCRAVAAAAITPRLRTTGEASHPTTGFAVDAGTDRLRSATDTVVVVVLRHPTLITEAAAVIDRDLRQDAAMAAVAMKGLPV